jgi:hypothetical protein
MFFSSTSPVSETETSTVDGFQGRDKDCILISFVRSNERYHTGDLLKDWHRVNVAFTRAKKKLLLIGSESTLRVLPLFRILFDYLHAKKWVRVYFSSNQADLTTKTGVRIACRCRRRLQIRAASRGSAAWTVAAIAAYLPS